MDVTEKIVTFCRNPNEYFLPLEIIDKNTHQEKECYFKNGFLKFPITSALIGLAVVKEVEHGNMAAMMTAYMDAVGFFSKDTGKLYLKDSVRYMEEFWDDQENMPGARLKYEPLPQKKMEQDLAEAVTKELEARVPKPAIDVLKDDISIAKADYFSCRDREADIQPVDIRDMMLFLMLTNNENVELYLAQPDKWLDMAKARLLERDGTVLYTIYEKRLKIHTILEAVKNTPHQWNRAKRLAETVADKTTVTVTTIDGETFRVKASGLAMSNCGQYDDLCILPKYREELLKRHHTEVYWFHIEEIKKVEYNGKVIFE